MDQGVKRVLWVCGAALGLHLIPLFMPRDTPRQDLAIARGIRLSSDRAKLLKPMKDNPKATAAELREAAELLADGAPLDAYELAKESERRQPGAVETLLLMARVCHGERMSRCEEEALTKAEKTAPTDPRAALLRADFQERVGDTQGALESVKRAYGQAPDREGVGERYARLLSVEGRGDEALEVLRQQEGRLGKARLWVEEGRVRVAQGRVKEGRVLFAKAVEENPKLAAGHYELGVAALRLGDLLGAEDALREANRLDMADMRPLEALCELHRRTGRMDELTAARMDLERRFPDRMDEARSACHAP